MDCGARVGYKKNKMKHRLCLIAGLFISSLLLAQPEAESPYSDQTFDPPVNAPWYEQPLLWAALVLFLLMAYYFLRRRRR